MTKQYSTNRALPGSLRSAADIANEASADLVGLFWMKQQNMNWVEFGKRLAANRKADKLTEVRRKSNSFLSLLRRPTPYSDIDEHLELAIKQGLPDLQGIYSACWNAAKEKARGSIDFQDPSRAMFRNLADLALPPSAIVTASPISGATPGRSN